MIKPVQPPPPPTNLLENVEELALDTADDALAVLGVDGGEDGQQQAAGAEIAGGVCHGHAQAELLQHGAAGDARAVFVDAHSC